MDYCQYHPIVPATYQCEQCDTHQCDHCIDEGERGSDTLCFNCKRSVEFLGAVNHVIPFWRRLDASFRYPMRANALALIVITSVLTTVLLFIPFGFVFSLMLTGVFFKYCFVALDNTAQGTLVPPNVTEAYSGGIGLLLRLLVIFIVIGGLAYGIALLLGPEFAGLFIFLATLALPAIIIIFATTDSLGDALNPANVMHLIAAIGLPYGLLLGFIMIMTASVGVITTLFAGNYSLISTILQSAISNYYTLVVFHIMGYMIFQYQGELGFIAGEDTGEQKEIRSTIERLAAKRNVFLKEGDYNAYVAVLKTALNKYPNDRELNKEYFEFIYATQRLQVLPEVATDYLKFLIRSKQDYQLTLVFKRILHLLPNYIPEASEVRHRIASACKESGDSLSAVKLLNGMQKTCSNYQQLPEAMELMADALEDLPNKKVQAEKCRELAKRLAARRPKPKTQLKKDIVKTMNTDPKPNTKPGKRALFQIDTSPEPVSVSISEKGESATPQVEVPPTDLPPIDFK